MKSYRSDRTYIALGLENVTHFKFSIDKKLFAFCNDSIFNFLAFLYLIEMPQKVKPKDQ